VREPDPAEPKRRDELVVAGADRLGTVEDRDAARTEPAELGDARLDAVELRPDVEVGEDQVARPGARGDLRRRQHGRLQADPPARRDERGGDGSFVPGDDEEPHVPSWCATAR
jgi:hypothetical protein